jgi:hypothetical protein
MTVAPKITHHQFRPAAPSESWIRDLRELRDVNQLGEARDVLRRRLDAYALHLAAVCASEFFRYGP